MPVPQRLNFLVEQASCLFIKGFDTKRYNQKALFLVHNPQP
ncbi:hypothetical protein QUB28_21075 [Microcoleus sp. B4-C3]